MDGLEHLLRDAPRVQARLRHSRDSEVAEAAVQFFARRVPSPNPYWYASETWREIMAVFHDLAPVQDPIWQSSDNKDHSTLKTRDTLLQVGQVVEIEGEEKHRCVTGMMGSPDRYHAYFRGQGAVPTGPIRWRVVADAPPESAAGRNGGGGGSVKQEPVGHPPDPGQAGRDDGDSSSIGPDQVPKSSGFIDRLRRHPVISALAFLGGVIGALGAVTESLDRIIQFLKKYAGW